MDGERDQPRMLFPERLRWIGLTALASLLFFFRLGSRCLPDYDEAIHAEVSKEILRTHSWLTLHWAYQPYYRKPPLSFWLRAVLFDWLGINEFWARALSALAGVALVLLIYAMARRQWGPRAALCSALVLLTIKRFVMEMRLGTTDALLCLGLYASFYAYLRARKGNPRWWYVVWACVSLAVMVKSAGAVVAPIAIAIDLVLNRDDNPPFPMREFSRGLMLAFLIAAPWHLWMMVAHGRAFVDDYLVRGLRRNVSVLCSKTGERLLSVVFRCACRTVRTSQGA